MKVSMLSSERSALSKGILIIVMASVTLLRSSDGYERALLLQQNESRPHDISIALHQVLRSGISADEAKRYKQLEVLFGAAVELGLEKYDVEIEEKVLVLMQHEVFKVRQAAMALLEKCAGARGAEALATVALESADKRERYQAVQALASIGGQEEALCKIIVSDPDPEVRSAAATSLGGLRYWGCVQLLISQFGVSKDERVGCSILRALGAIGDRSSVPLLIEQLGSNNERIVAAAARALYSCADERAVDPLLSLLEKRNLDEDIALWSSSAIFTVLSDVDPNASIEQVKSFWKERKNMYRLDDALRGQLREAKSWRQAVSGILKIRRAQARCLAPDLSLMLQRALLKDPSVRLVLFEALGEWRDVQGLYGLVGFLDEQGPLGLVPDEQRSAYRNRALRILRRATGQNFYKNPQEWTRHLDRLCHETIPGTQ